MDTKKVYYSHNNVLVNSDNGLWIMGSNAYKRTGFKEEFLKDFQFTGINLDDDEIDKFYCYSNLLAIYTKKHKLYISGNSKSDKCKRCDHHDESDDESDDDDSEYNSEDEVSVYSGVSNHGASHARVPDNDEYFDYMSQISNSNIKRFTGLMMFEENIDDISFIKKSIFYRKNSDIYLINFDFAPSDKIKCNINMSIQQNGYFYKYQLQFPFEHEKIQFMNNFIYCYSNNYHHVVTMADGEPHWFFFSFPELLDMNEIHYSFYDDTIYIKKNDKIYYYSLYHEKIIDSNYIDLREAPNKMLLIEKEEHIEYSDYVNIKYKHSGSFLSSLNDYIVDANPNIGIVNITDSNDPNYGKMYFKQDDWVYLNIHSVKKYGLYPETAIYCLDNTLYVIRTGSCVKSSKKSTKSKKSKKNEFPNQNEIDSSNKYKVFLVENTPETIDSIEFMSEMIVIQSGNVYYYSKFTDEKPTFEFTKIEFSENFVMPNLIDTRKKKYKSTIDLTVDIECNKLDELTSICSVLPNDSDFFVNYSRKKLKISHGSGVKKDLLDSAIYEFSSKYLIHHGLITEFKLDILKDLTDTELFNLGYVLHVIIHNIGSPNFRFPLVFVSELAQRDPFLFELEYFVRNHDEKAFNIIRSIKNNIEEINNAGFTSYSDCLKSMCKFERNDEINRIVKLLVEGFLCFFEILNLKSMNLPTVDFYLSGNLSINRDILIKNLVIDANNNSSKIKETIVDIINTLPEEKLTILLKNWSGVSTLDNDNYIIIFENTNTDIRFSVCSREIVINNKLLDDKELLVDILTSPYNSIKD